MGSLAGMEPSQARRRKGQPALQRTHTHPKQPLLTRHNRPPLHSRRLLVLQHVRGRAMFSAINRVCMFTKGRLRVLPSESITWPVIHRASSVLSQAIRRVASSGWPQRSRGILLRIRSYLSGPAHPVSVAPGLTVFTVIPCLHKLVR